MQLIGSGVDSHTFELACIEFAEHKKTQQHNERSQIYSGYFNQSF